MPLPNPYTQLMVLRKQVKRKARRLKKYKRLAYARWRRVSHIRSKLLEEVRQLMVTRQRNDAELRRMRARHSQDGILLVYKRWLRRWRKTLRKQRRQLEEERQLEEQRDRHLSQLKRKFRRHPKYEMFVDKSFKKLRKSLVDWLKTPNKDPTVEAMVRNWEVEVLSIRNYLINLNLDRQSHKKHGKKRSRDKSGISNFAMFWDMEVQRRKPKWLPLTISPNRLPYIEHRFLDVTKRAERFRPSSSIECFDFSPDPKEIKVKILKPKRKSRANQNDLKLADIETLFRKVLDEQQTQPDKTAKKTTKKRKRKRIGKQRQVSKYEEDLLQMLNLNNPIEKRVVTKKSYSTPRRSIDSRIQNIERRETLNEKQLLDSMGQKKSVQLPKKRQFLKDFRGKRRSPRRSQQSDDKSSKSKDITKDGKTLKSIKDIERPQETEADSVKSGLKSIIKTKEKWPSFLKKPKLKIREEKTDKSNEKIKTVREKSPKIRKSSVKERPQPIVKEEVEEHPAENKLPSVSDLSNYSFVSDSFSNEDEMEYLEDIFRNNNLRSSASHEEFGVPKLSETGIEELTTILEPKQERVKSIHSGSLELSPPNPKTPENQFQELELPPSEASRKETKVSSKISKILKKFDRKIDRLGEKRVSIKESSVSKKKGSIRKRSIDSLGKRKRKVIVPDFAEFPKLPKRKDEVIEEPPIVVDPQLNTRVAIEGDSVQSILNTPLDRKIFYLEELNSQEKYRSIQNFLKDTIEQNNILNTVPDVAAFMKVVENHHMWKNLNGLHDEMESAGFTKEDMHNILSDKYLQYLTKIVSDVRNKGNIVTLRGQEVVRLSGKPKKPRPKFDAGFHLEHFRHKIRPWGRTPNSEVFVPDTRPLSTSIIYTPSLRTPRQSHWQKQIILEQEQEQEKQQQEQEQKQQQEQEQEQNQVQLFEPEKIDDTKEDYSELDSFLSKIHAANSVHISKYKFNVDKEVEFEEKLKQKNHEEKIKKLFYNYGVEATSQLSIQESFELNLYNVEKRYSITALNEVLTGYINYFKKRRKSPFVLELERQKRRRHKRPKPLPKIRVKVSKPKHNWRRSLQKPKNLRTIEQLYYSPRQTCREADTSDDASECSECGERLDTCTWEKCPRCGVEVAIPSATLSADSIEACAKNKLIRSLTKDICQRCGFIHAKGSPCPQLACPGKHNAIPQLQLIEAAAKNHLPECPNAEAPKFCSPCNVTNS